MIGSIWLSWLGTTSSGPVLAASSSSPATRKPPPPRQRRQQPRRAAGRPPAPAVAQNGFVNTLVSVESSRPLPSSALIMVTT